MKEVKIDAESVLATFSLLVRHTRVGSFLSFQSKWSFAVKWGEGAVAYQEVKLSTFSLKERTLERCHKRGGNAPALLSKSSSEEDISST